jgi:GMP synthase-like glutamine amidotransferase
MRIGVLQTGGPPPELVQRFGTYPQMLETLLRGGGRQFADFDVAAGAWPGRPEDFDAYLITGSAAGVYDDLPWIAPLKAFLNQAKGKAALVGVCFGHQIMAEAFGGRVEKSAKGWGVGLHRYRVLNRQPWMDDAESFSIPASHQDQVVVQPPASVLVAADDFTAYAALAYTGHRAISFQGHPEFDPAYAQALLHTRRGSRLSHEQADAAIESLEQPNDRARVGRWIVDFLEGTLTATAPRAASS